jgi:hypothetical protein
MPQSPRINIAAVIGTPKFDGDAQELSSRVNSSWRVTRFSAVLDKDIVAQVESALPTAKHRVGVLEIIAHASPEFIGGIQVSEASTVGAALQSLDAIDEETQIYLSGCNTACSLFDRRIAPVFAVATAATTLGSVGFLTGFHALGTEQTTRTHPQHLDSAIADCSRDALADECWTAFPPDAQLAPGNDAPPNELTDEALERVRQLIDEAQRGAPLSEPLSNRLGPDAVVEFAVPPDDTRQTYAILAGGVFLRNEGTDVVWRFPRGRQVLALLLSPNVR